MRSIQNEQSTLTQKAYKHETDATSIQEAITALSQRFQARANKMHKKRRTRDDRAYWRTRGRQQVLWRVSAHLQAMQTEYASPYMLYLALKEYLDYCLDKCNIDADEERHATCPRNGLPTQQWKAEGEAQELPAIRRALSGLVDAHVPHFVRHMLSLNGKNLVSLWEESYEGPPLERGECRSETVRPAEPVLRWPRLSIA